jgi:O-antigen/teichoic acid export membrane protein
MRQVGFSLADQGFAVAGGFLANVALARSQTKQEYGVFALWYSVFTFLLGLYYAVVLEPCTVHGSGRYRERFSEYLRLIIRLNAILCVLLTGTLLLACLLLSWVAPRLMSRSLLGLALTAGVLLSAYLLRRLFYVQREPVFAAKSSLVFFITLVVELWLLTKSHRINSLTVFVAMAFGWIAAGAAFGRRLQFGASTPPFLSAEPNYLSEHWKYSKWVLATAFVFQFTHQGYYWLLGLFLSATEVANLRALYLLVGPVEQVFIAFSYLIVPALSAHYAAKRMGDFFSVWRRYALVTAAVSITYVLVTRILGNAVVHIVYGGKYDGLAPYLFVLALVPMVLWIGTTMGHALNAAERPKFQFWAYVSSAIATFVLGVPLVIHFGLWGAVYGMLVSSGTYTVALAVSFLLNFWNPFSRHADLL